MKAISISTAFTRDEKSLEKTKSVPNLTDATITSDEYILSLLQQQGNYDQGFRLLVQQYRERLYHHVRRMVGNHEDADDVLQNCFVKVYRSIHRFEQNSKLYTWLYRIATNEALTFLDKRKRIATASLDNEDTNWNKMTYADMSDTLETSQGALKASYHHAVKKIEAYVRENAEK